LGLEKKGVGDGERKIIREEWEDGKSGERVN
jgi:hypothetical protein